VLAGLLSLGVLALIGARVVLDALTAGERNKTAAVARVTELRNEAQRRGDAATVEVLDRAIAEFRKGLYGY
jgi:hypothetical protein